MEINLNALSVAGEDNCDLPESFTSTSFDLDQFSSWSNFLSPFRTISETPVIESPIQMDTLNTSSVMSSKIEDQPGSLVKPPPTLQRPVPSQLSLETIRTSRKKD
ncbi:hypothetical protein CEXT_265091 [Caerostris extrusa]|uniref:Uncharacterized protein n=1 Tax=Caerostris extrusa TaxID=172846 RepID=A0AAV4N7I7_CAEEX|nr:hypothetical protein CEXT_265091 [Caerostris extrusa]